MVAGRETRKMNMYQAVRDAMRCDFFVWARLGRPDASRQHSVDEGRLRRRLRRGRRVWGRVQVHDGAGRGIRCGHSYHLGLRGLHRHRLQAGSGSSTPRSRNKESRVLASDLPRWATLRLPKSSSPITSSPHLTRSVRVRDGVMSPLLMPPTP